MRSIQENKKGGNRNLGIRKLVEASGHPDGKVTPDVVVTAEAELLHVSSRRLEACLWVLCGDSHCNDVALGLGLDLGFIAKPAKSNKPG